MTAVSIPYHLRPNKAIDRYAFTELLAKINNFENQISCYKYIGFGGFSLEDFRMLHFRFGIKEMCSLENNAENYKRQQFNKPISCIELKHCSSDEYINNFTNDTDEDRTIIWLDYTSPKELRSQINEFQSCIEKLFALDIIKITLNANPSSLCSGDNMHVRRLEKLTEILEDLLPAEVTDKHMTHKEYPKVLFSVLGQASKKIMGYSSLYLQPLSCFVYKDGGHQMLTMTAVLLEDDKDLVNSFFEKTAIKQWELCRTDWSEIPIEINLPELTIKERIFIDSLLPDTDITEIHQRLGFLLSDTHDSSIDLLKTYLLFYKQMPMFSKILL